ncbi:hypothetical protein BGP77_00085 [Saccharospirillum sp. MSK14-1]|uniref:DUF2058 domain-containing protein n=1 Tax=Saccharospirillum sp. MSK14-1 TaxID=1897632 RepID=UPI000D367277|nr:DUF2058 domain-containing protein [Saccharospirillum sp. MSK14-1]PTY35767.1 hypothetical protein BGP77_00085 [Saccharospirillum sp. MSK14-1]
MAKSLADQLLNAGLVDKKKAKQAEQQKRKTSRQQQKGKAEPDETQQRLAKERAEKAERDRELNRQRQHAEQAKALRAQAWQMLRQSEVSASGEVRFSFTDPRVNKIKQLYVDETAQAQLAKGRLAICADDERFYVVPRNVADKVAERFADAVIFIADTKAVEPDEDDPYKDFPIPDDLMW